MRHGDDAQHHISTYWSDHAEDYDAHRLSQIHMGPATPLWGEVWTAALPPPPADVLDVGTGTGQVSILLAGLGFDVVGTDLAGGMLALARRKASQMKTPPKLQVGDAVQPDFCEQSFDVVTSRYLLWTLREPQTALRNWFDLLRPGGRLAVVDGIWHSEGIHTEGTRDQDRVDFCRRYSTAVLAELPLAEARTIHETADLIVDAGFNEVSITPLPQILEAELAHGASEQDTRLQYLITGSRP